MPWNLSNQETARGIEGKQVCLQKCYLHVSLSCQLLVATSQEVYLSQKYEEGKYLFPPIC